MNDRFEELIQNLAHVFQMPLHVDHNRGCAIQIQQGLVIQLHSDLEMERLLISCQIIEIPPGKFRENVLREALKANGKPSPIVGILSYITRTNTLFLFQRHPFDILTAENVAAMIPPFFDYAQSWRNAIEKGHSAPLEEPPKKPIFPGLKP